MVNNLLSLLRGTNSQSDMAEKYGVSQQTWSSWEKGRTCPELSIMLQIQQEFGIPLEVIFFEESNYKMKLNTITQEA